MRLSEYIHGSRLRRRRARALLACFALLLPSFPQPSYLATPSLKSTHYAAQIRNRRSVFASPRFRPPTD